MAFKMNNSPAKFMWPWSKKAREKRRLNRAYKDFDKNTVVYNDRTYDKSNYDEVVSNYTPDEERISELRNLSTEDLMNLKDKQGI